MIQVFKEGTSNQSIARELFFRAAKAALKALLIYLVYILASSLLFPLSSVIPGFMHTVETFTVTFIVLMILADLTQGTILQHFFNAARALFMIAYWLFSMGDGTIGGSFEGMNLTLNLTLFYAIAVMLGLLGFAKTILQAINFMSEKAEIDKRLKL